MQSVASGFFKRKNDNDKKPYYKARLVAKGYAQVQGVNFEDTYFPVVRFTTLRILFAYAAKNDLEAYHFDVETAYLHRELEDEVYMELPEEFKSADQEGKARIFMGLFGLEQRSKNWYDKLTYELINKVKLIQSLYDTCVFFKRTKNKIIIIAVFVDDIMIFSNCVDFVNLVKEELSKYFPIKNLGSERRFLEINIHRNKRAGTYQLD